MKNWKHYKNKTYTQQEARKMDYELDLIHDFVCEVYNDDYWSERVSDLLDKIKNCVYSK